MVLSCRGKSTAAEPKSQFLDTSPEDDDPASQKPLYINKAPKQVEMNSLMQPVKLLADADSTEALGHELLYANDVNTQ